MRELGIFEDLLNTLSTTVDELKQLYLASNPSTEDFCNFLLKLSYFIFIFFIFSCAKTFCFGKHCRFKRYL